MKLIYKIKLIFKNNRKKIKKDIKNINRCTSNRIKLKKKIIFIH